MAYQSKNLSALGYANGFTLWHYRTDDALADTLADGYFGPNVARMVRAGDVVIVNASVNSGSRETAQLTVTSLDGGNVAVAVMTAAIADASGGAVDEVTDESFTDDMWNAAERAWVTASKREGATRRECWVAAISDALHARRQP